MLDRAVQNGLGQQVFKQRNRERIAAKTKDILETDPPEIDAKEEISTGWTHKFSDEAGKHSDENMQLYFAKILAGEVKKPGSYSPRTLRTLGEMTRRTGTGFQALCNLSMLLTNQQAIVVSAPFGASGNNALQNFGLNYQTLTYLMEEGLIVNDLNSHWPLINFLAPIRYGPGEIFFNPIDEQREKIKMDERIGTVNLSNVGNELRNIIVTNPNEEYTKRCFSWFKSKGMIACEVIGKNEKGEIIGRPISFEGSAGDPSVA